MYLVLGKNGYIAQAIIKELERRQLNYLALSRSDLDYTDFKEFTCFYHTNYNSHSTPTKNCKIINCAGYIGKPNVDACESNKGDTIMIVEAMKTMNHVPSTSDGVVKEICVEDGQPVEFDQKIIVLE